MIRNKLQNCLTRVMDRAGFWIIRKTDDPFIRDLLDLYRSARANPRQFYLIQHQISRIAALGHLRAMVKSGITDVIDVGANRGQFALDLLKLGYEGRIHSFEPMNEAFQELARIAVNHKNWDVYNFAIGDENGVCELGIFSDETFSSLHAANPNGERHFSSMLEKIKSQSVDVKTMASVWNDLGIAADAVILFKTDTQGHDMAVLRGCGSLISKFTRLMTEASIVPIYHGQALFKDLVLFLEEHGFSPTGFYTLSADKEYFGILEMDAFFTKTKTEN